jgi:oxaloacetate decarboxylase (Na+ extruding) subunit gamma
MVIGMTIVFAFLMMLVGLLVLMSKAVARWGPEEPLPASRSRCPSVGLAGGDDAVDCRHRRGDPAHRRRHRR